MFFQKNLGLSLLLLMTLAAANAQQEPQYTQYMYNPLSINPAYAGARETTSVIGLYRAQWVGLDGAPSTGQLAAHTPIGRQNHGIGLSVMNESVEPASSTYATVSFAYAIPLSRETVFRFGVMAGGHSLEVDYNKLNPENPETGEFSGKLSRFSPNVGVGAYFYSEDWFISLSTPTLLETKFYDDVRQSTASQKMHLYLSAGHTLRLSNDWDLKPATMLSVVNGGSAKVDLSANFVYDRRFSIGTAYRFEAAFSTMAGFQVSESIFIGYAYDRDINRLGNFNSGSHEVFLRFDLFGKYCKCYL